MATLVPLARKIREFVLGGIEKAQLGGVWIPSGPATSVGGREVRPKGWQMDAWRFWHKLGEVRFPTEHLARQLARLEWDVEVDGTQLPKDEAAALLEEVTFGLGTAEASRLGGLNLQVGGEGWWLEESPGTFAIYSVITPGLEKKVRDTRAAGRMALRFYFPDPVVTDHAESAVQTILGAADELITLEGLSRAQSRSRIAQAGLLLVPSGATWEGDADPFGKDLETAMELAIRDVTHPSSMVPIKVEMPEELIEKVVHKTFERSYDNKVHEKVERATRRIALGLDIPAELLLGTGDATHWTAWLTALETYTSHLEPLAIPIGELYAAVAEMLLERVGRQVTVKVTPNPKNLLAKRSTVRDALDAAKLGAVGLRYVREAIGAAEEDAPTPEELEILLRIPRETGREPMADEGTGEATPSGPDPVSAAIVVDAAQPVAAAMSIALMNMRNRVGAKVRATVQGDAELRERLAPVENSEVVATLGAEAAAAAVDINTLVTEGLAPFRAWWTRERPSATSPNVATTLFAIWAADTLDRPDDEVAKVPDRIIDEVIAGQPPDRGGSHAAA